MKVIVEGVDLAGKTTFLEKLSKRMNEGCILKNALKPRAEGDTAKLKQQYEDLLAMAEAQPEMLVFFDRFYPSQLVYSVLRGHDDMSDAWYSEFETTSFQTRSCLIMIYEDDGELTRRYRLRGDEHVSEEQMLTLSKRYDIFFENCTLPKVKLWSRDPEYIEKAIAFIMQNRGASV